ncbi:MAG TPA: hypothetical protein PLA44_12995 [Propionibacteriaceae bacterium]|nr:hypothetical protein [Propionibacteriaceae bacterium]
MSERVDSAEADGPKRMRLRYAGRCDADWPLLGSAFQVRGVDVVSPRKLAGLLAEVGPLNEAAIGVVARAVASAFPRA